MFNPFTNEDDYLNEAIVSAFADLKSFDTTEEGYHVTTDQISKLYALRTNNAQLTLQAQQTHAAHQLECDKNAWQEEQDARWFGARIDPNTAVSVLGNLLVAVVVVKYEQRNVISTKVINFLTKRI